MAGANKTNGPVVASFDVFDTSLIRRVVAPSEAFRVLAREVAKRIRQEPDAIFEDDFIAARMEAERRARRSNSREEVTLEEIWRELARMLPRRTLEGTDFRVELDIEAGLLGPLHATTQNIADLRNAGRRVIFISDSYFPAWFVRENLLRHGLMLPHDGLYVSSESGLVKRTGRLFELVLREEKLAPEELEHCGDDPISDQAAPARLGIATRPFVASFRNRVENLLVDGPSSLGAPRLALAGELRFKRLGQPRIEASEAVRALVESFLGPFTCIMGHWVLAQARARGLKRLYFAARDARLLHLVCERLERSRNSPLECRYLHVSRRALLLAGSRDTQPENLTWVRRDFEVSSLNDLARKLELAPETLLGAWNRRGEPVDAGTRILVSSDDWNRFWTLVKGPLANEIETSIRLRRDAARGYFASVGLADGNATAGYIDLGWFLTCQEAINRLVDGQAGAFAVHGLYLAIRPSRRGPAEAGPAEAIFRFNAPDLPPGLAGSTLNGRETLLEHIVGLADHPTLLGYGPEGRPIHAAASPRDRESGEMFAQLIPPLLAYADQYGASWARVAADTSESRLLLSALTDVFFRDPLPSYAGWLEKLPCSKPEGGDSTITPCSPYTLQEALSALLPDALRGTSKRTSPRPWPEAALALTPMRTRRILRLAPSVRKAWHRLGL